MLRGSAGDARSARQRLGPPGAPARLARRDRRQPEAAAAVCVRDRRRQYVCVCVRARVSLLRVMMTRGEGLAHTQVLILCRWEIRNSVTRCVKGKLMSEICKITFLM